MKKIHFLLSVLIFVLYGSAYSQVSFSGNAVEIEKIKNGTTCIAMKDTASAIALEYKEVFKKYWTFSKIKFIKYADIDKNISLENSFLTIGGYETTVQNVKLYSDGSTKNGIDYSNTHLYLELWTCSGDYFSSKKKKEFSNADQNLVARVELFTDFATLMKPENIYKTDYDGDGHIYNWGKGILKNYIQILTSFLETGEERDLYKGVKEKDKLKELKTQTLYIPDYVYNMLNKITGDETEKNDKDKILTDYKYNYKVMPIKDLNDSIMNKSESFYYLIYVKSSTDKYITVVNSLTGEIIYTTYTPMSYNIKSGDIKDLYNAVIGK